MDPASAIGTTSAVLSFISFIGKTISVARQLHDTQGTTLELQRLNDLSAGLHSSLGELEKDLLTKEQNGIAISASESSLRAVLGHCVAIETKIRDLAG